MKAIILAAGMGKRLGKYTKGGTKCMVEVNGIPLIDRMVDGLHANGITDIVVVVGYCADGLIEHLVHKKQYQNLTFVMNEIYDKTNNIYSLWLAREYMASGDCLLLESDLVFKEELLTSLLQDPAPNVAVVSSFETWMDGTVTLLDENEMIVSVIDKKHFEWAHIGNYYKTVNVYKFSKEFSVKHYLPFMQAYLTSFGSNDYYEQVLKVIAFLDNVKIKGLQVSPRIWFEIDDPHDLDVASTIFSEGPDKTARIQQRYGGYWRFPEMLDFCYLVNPLFPTPHMMEELKTSMADLVQQYPSGMRVQSILAGKTFSVDPEQVVVGNGAAELIASLFRRQSGRVMIPNPTFLEYVERIGRDRCAFFPTAPHGFDLPIDAFLEAVGEDIGTIILVNPDNPTGFCLDHPGILRILQFCQEQHKKLVVDESFIDFAAPEQRYSLLQDDFLAEHPELVVIKSISKSYGVPGLRLGVLASGDLDLVAQIKKDVAIWNINSLAEFFLQIVDKYKSRYWHSCDEIALERARLTRDLSALPGVRVYPSQANYVLCQLETSLKGPELVDRLLNDFGVYIKDCSGREGFPAGTFVRLAVRDRKDDARLVQALGLLLTAAPASPSC